MEDNSSLLLLYKKKNRRAKISLIIMGVLLVLSLTTTIVLASFQAQRNSNATLLFLDGVTLKLSKTNTSGASTASITNDSAGSATADFNYAPASNLSANATLDGISCQVLTQSAFLAYSVRVFDNTTAVKGSWNTFNSSNQAIFTPSVNGSNNNWRVRLTVPSNTWTGTATSASTGAFKVLQTSTTATAANASLVLFSKIEMYGSSNDADVTPLAGKTMILKFILSAHTTDRNTDLV